MDIADVTELNRLRGKRRKNDHNDALDAAVRLAHGNCPLGWIADEHVSHLHQTFSQHDHNFYGFPLA